MRRGRENILGGAFQSVRGGGDFRMVEMQRGQALFEAGRRTGSYQ